MAKSVKKQNQASMSVANFKSACSKCGGKLTSYGWLFHRTLNAIQIAKTSYPEENFIASRFLRVPTRTLNFRDGKIVRLSVGQQSGGVRRHQKKVESWKQSRDEDEATVQDFSTFFCKCDRHYSVVNGKLLGFFW